MSDHDKVMEIIRLREQAPLALDPSRTALLLIDMQRDFVRPDYAFAQACEKLVPGATAAYFHRVQNTVVPNVRRLLEIFRSHKLPVVFTGTGTRTGNGKDLPRWLREFDELSRQVLGKPMWPERNDPAWQIDESVAPAPGELIVNKTSSDGFSTTSVDQALRHMGVETVVVTGLTTDVCVASTARQAADRGYQVIVVEDACTTLSEEMHRGALDAIRLAFGRVSKTEEVVRLLATALAAAR